MVTPLLNTKFSYLYIILAILLFITAPILMGLIALLYIGYWYLFRNAQTAHQIALNYPTLNGRLLLVACILTVATIFVHNTVDYVTTFGFPTTVMTYYHYPVDISTSGLAGIFSQLAFNPLQALVNFGLYLLFLFAIRQIWRIRTK